jgi:hypothetical protein
VSWAVAPDALGATDVASGPIALALVRRTPGGKLDPFPLATTTASAGGADGGGSALWRLPRVAVPADAPGTTYFIRATSHARPALLGYSRGFVLRALEEAERPPAAAVSAPAAEAIWRTNASVLVQWKARDGGEGDASDASDADGSSGATLVDVELGELALDGSWAPVATIASGVPVSARRAAWVVPASLPARET